MSSYAISITGNFASIVVINDGDNEIISDGNPQNVIPLCAMYNGTELIYGTPAYNDAETYPENTIYSIASLISTPPDEIEQIKPCFDQELIETDGTIAVKFNSVTITREEIMQGFFNYLASLFISKVNPNNGFLTVSDCLQQSSYKILIESAESSGIHFNRIVKNSTCIYALTNPEVINGDLLLMYDFANNFTGYFLNSNMEIVNQFVNDSSVNILTNSIHYIISLQLSKGKNSIKIEDYPDIDKKIMTYSRMMAYKLQFEENVTHSIVIDGEHPIDTTVTVSLLKALIYANEQFELIKQSIVEFKEREGIDSAKVKKCILLDQAYRFSFIYDDMVNEDECFRGTEKIEFDSFQGYSNGAAIVSKNFSKYQTYIIKSSTEYELDKSAAADGFSYPDLDKLLPISTSPTSVPSTSPTSVPSTSPSSVPSTSPSSNRLQIFIDSLLALEKEKEKDMSIRPAYIRTLNFQINSIRNFAEENLNPQESLIDEYLQPIRKQISRLFPDWIQP